jgi:hypothetical protein
MPPKKSNKRKDRIEENTELHASAVADENLSKILKTKGDDKLFVVDTTGSNNSRRKVIKEVAEKASGKKEYVHKLDTKVKANAAQVALALKKREEAATEFAMHDLWTNDKKEKGKPVRAKEIKTKIAVPGLSYNPSLNDHQDALAEGLALEVEKVEKEAKKNARLDDASIMSELTLSVMNTGDPESDEDEEDDEANPNRNRLSRRLRSKFTRAQRNKLRTRREENYGKNRDKMEADMLKSINTVPTILKALNVDKQVQQNRKAVAAAHAKEKLLQEQHMETTGMTYQEAGAIPLSDELQGSLRQMKPKGVLLNEEVSKLQKAGDMMEQDRRKRRKGEKPHGQEKIRWVAKHKYV